MHRGDPPEDANGILNDLAQQVTASGPLQHGQRLSYILDGFDLIGIIQPTIALDKYGPGAVRLQQLTWPDPGGRLPWEDSYTMPPGHQPVIADPSQPPP